MHADVCTEEKVLTSLVYPMCTHTLTSRSVLYTAELHTVNIVVLLLQAELDVIFSPSAIVLDQISSGTIRTQVAAVTEKTAASLDERLFIHLKSALTEVRECSHTYVVVYKLCFTYILSALWTPVA